MYGLQLYCIADACRYTHCIGVFLCDVLLLLLIIRVVHLCVCILVPECYAVFSCLSLALVYIPLSLKFIEESVKGLDTPPNLQLLCN